MRDFKREILEKLVCSYRKSSKNKRGITGKKTCIKPAQSEGSDPSYFKAAGELETLGFVKVTRKKYVDVITEIILIDDQVESAEDFLEEQYGILPWPKQKADCLRIIETYGGQCCTPAAGRRMSDFKKRIEKNEIPSGYAAEEDIIRSLIRIEGNKTPIYVRELSIGLFHDSKKFERDIMNVACSYLRKVYNKPVAEIAGEKDLNDEILADFHITRPLPKIFVKGSLKIYMGERVIDVNPFSSFESGLSIGDADFAKITKLEIEGNRFITIENKTSYARMVPDENTVCFYLAGFCARSRRDFLKMICRDNPDIAYLHFGDMDVGGLRILENLKEITGIQFKPYLMDTASADAHKDTSKPLTERDRKGMEKFLENEEYSELAAYSLEHGIKIEQEAIQT